ncbi:hypothetical protein ACMFMG_005291 [Clarireedia jacksonii]
MTATTPLPHASSDDYTGAVIAFTSVILALSTIAIALRCLARSNTKDVRIALDDGFAVFGWLGFLGNCIANIVLAQQRMVAPYTLTSPSPSQAIIGANAIASVGITYPVAVTGAKLSLLFLFRRIFGMRETWFRWVWWGVMAIVMAWFIVAITWGSLGIAKVLSLEVELDFAVPTVTILNTISDIFVLTLPVRMTYKLRLSIQQRASVIFVFLLGSGGTIVSLVRCIRNFKSKQQGWDSRYQLFCETMLGTAEAGVILICACLPVMRPLFRSLKGFVVTSFNTTTGRTNYSSGSGSGSRFGRSRDASGIRGTKNHISLGSREFGESDEAPINLKDNVIHRRVDVDVDSSSRHSET